ncbi:unnamed protein product, partial [Heterotrigona itama]
MVRRAVAFSGSHRRISHSSRSLRLSLFKGERMTSRAQKCSLEFPRNSRNATREAGWRIWNISHVSVTRLISLEFSRNSTNAVRKAEGFSQKRP